MAKRVNERPRIRVQQHAQHGGDGPASSSLESGHAKGLGNGFQRRGSRRRQFGEVRAADRRHRHKTHCDIEEHGHHQRRHDGLGIVRCGSWTSSPSVAATVAGIGDEHERSGMQEGVKDVSPAAGTRRDKVGGRAGARRRDTEEHERPSTPKVIDTMTVFVQLERRIPPRITAVRMATRRPLAMRAPSLWMP